MLEIGPALVNDAFDVKFCICVGGNFQTLIFFGKHVLQFHGPVARFPVIFGWERPQRGMFLENRSF